jgi:hypothetical protein
MRTMLATGATSRMKLKDSFSGDDVNARYLTPAFAEQRGER